MSEYTSQSVCIRVTATNPLIFTAFDGNLSHRMFPEEKKKKKKTGTEC